MLRRAEVSILERVEEIGPTGASEQPIRGPESDAGLDAEPPVGAREIAEDGLCGAPAERLIDGRLDSGGIEPKPFDRTRHRASRTREKASGDPHTSSKTPSLTAAPHLVERVRHLGAAKVADNVDERARQRGRRTRISAIELPRERPRGRRPDVVTGIAPSSRTKERLDRRSDRLVGIHGEPLRRTLDDRRQPPDVPFGDTERLGERGHSLASGELSAHLLDRERLELTRHANVQCPWIRFWRGDLRAEGQAGCLG
jgi:hypothetical protein